MGDAHNNNENNGTNEKNGNELKNVNENEQQLEKLPYPKSVFFIISNEFCERFSYYGMRTILSIYLTEILLYGESDAKIIYHTFTMLTYFFPLLGAILSDSYLGRFRTILYVSMIYASGNILLSLSATDPIGIPKKPFSILALLLIAIGTGGIKPCVSAFGGDQFVLPQQALQFATFFSLFYFSINAGSLISTFLTPVLREDVHCFGTDSCYPLAFAVPGILMIISIIIFAAGKPLYRIKEPEGNVCLQVVKCIGYAVKKKVRSNKRVGHWLDHSEQAYGKKLVEDVKATLKVFVLYAPLPIFWALYDQQGTGWTFQAVRMNGNIGFYTILPDQMQVVNPVLILIFIPLFNYWIYPLLGKCHLLRTPLQRMVCGGLLAAVAFGISACISLALEATYPVLPSEGNSQIRIYNSLNCNASLDLTVGNKDKSVDLLIGQYEKFDVDVKDNVTFIVNAIKNCNEYAGPAPPLKFTIKETTTNGFYLNENKFEMFADNIDKDKSGLPKIRTIVSNIKDTTKNITFLDSTGDVALSFPVVNISQHSLDPGTYKIKDSELKFTVELGGVYTVLLRLADDGKPASRDILTITKPNSVHMLWLLPQYIIITAAEIMFSITGLEFSYSQAPTTMKSVLQAAYLLTDSLGNVIIVIIESAKLFEKQSSDFFLYTALMILDMVLFAFLAVRYKYVTIKEDENENETKIEENGKDNNELALDNPAYKYSGDD